MFHCYTLFLSFVFTIVASIINLEPAVRELTKIRPKLNHKLGMTI